MYGLERYLGRRAGVLPAPPSLPLQVATHKQLRYIVQSPLPCRGHREPDHLAESGGQAEAGGPDGGKLQLVREGKEGVEGGEQSSLGAAHPPEQPWRPGDSRWL